MVAPIPLASRYPTSGATSLILRCIVLAILDPVDIITPVHTLSNSSTTRPGTYPSSTTILTIETDDNTLERMRVKPIDPDQPPASSTFKRTRATDIHRKSHGISSIRRMPEPRKAGQT